MDMVAAVFIKSQICLSSRWINLARDVAGTAGSPKVGRCGDIVCHPWSAFLGFHLHTLLCMRVVDGSEYHSIFVISTLTQESHNTTAENTNGRRA